MAAAATVIQNIAVTTDTPTLAGTSQVETGSKINGFFIICEVSRTGTTSDVLPNVYFMLSKNPGGNITPPAPNAVGASDNKRYTIHQEMVMLQGFNAGNPRTLFKGVIAIPRGYRRNAPNDSWQVSIQSPGVNISACLQVHYKEFR